MLLYLLRHGDAIDSPQFDDSERPLSELGKKQAATVGSFLRSSKVSIDCILSSPLARAVQTATIVSEKIHLNKIDSTEYLMPGTRKSQLFDRLNAIQLESVLLVGHEPHLSQSTSLLLSSREDLPFEFKKCSLACLLVSMPVRKGHGLLEWFLSHQQMDLLNR